ncbi:hypothetical protein M513_05453, partial [Trichuris suis]
LLRVVSLIPVVTVCLYARVSLCRQLTRCGLSFNFNKLLMCELISRPGYGCQGNPVQLVSNFVEVKTVGSQYIIVWQYRVHVTCSKVKLTRDDKRCVFWKLVNERQTIFKDPFGLAYDGDSILFSRRPLPIGHTETLVTKLTVRLVRKLHPVEVRFSIKCCGMVRMVFKSLMRGASLTTGLHESPEHVVDVVLSQGRTCTLVGQSETFCIVGSTAYEKPKNRGIDIKVGVELWRGLSMSARVGEGYRPMINVDVSYAPFYRPQSVLSYMCNVLNGSMSPPRYLIEQIRSNTRLSCRELQIVSDAVKGLFVTVTHRKCDSQLLISGLVPDATRHMVTLRNSEHISVANYFKKVYFELRFPHMPVLKAADKNKTIYLPVEVCMVADKLPYEASKLSCFQTGLQNRQCVKDAPTRLQMCMEMMRQANLENDRFLKQFGLEIGQTFLEVAGHILAPPKLEYKHAGGAAAVVQPSNGAWQMGNAQFFQGANVDSFSVISFGPIQSLNSVELFCTQVAKACIDLGMNMRLRPDMLLVAHSIEAFEDTLERLLAQYKLLHRECRLVFVALSDYRNEYTEVKRIAEMKFGIITQCFLPKVLYHVTMRDSLMMATNLALKINMKMGGVNTRLLPDPLVKTNLMDKVTLALGISLTQAPPANKDSVTIAAVVGSLDVNSTKYAASLCVRAPRSTVLLYLVDELRERVNAFVEASYSKPSRIIVFRNGVTDSQFQQLLDEELMALRMACEGLDKAYHPGITFIVVQKGHRAKFICKDESMAVGQGRNIPAGTVIDRQITSADGFDFYLCSHSGSHGTSKPAKYHVLYDDNNLDSDTLQAITYYLCHAHGRCMRSVSIPAPVYFAHLACRRARHHIYFDSESNEPGDIALPRVHENIQSSMYFV